jgi:hypothetical protein
MASGLRPGEALVAAEALRDLQDRIYVLQTAIEDAEADLADEASLRTYTEAFRSVHQAAQAVIATRLEPRALTGD